ncbi:MAG: phosphatase PAP2 family protein [Bacteroidota bacterium]
MSRRLFFLIGLFISQIAFPQQVEKNNRQLKIFKTVAAPIFLISFGLFCENENGYPSSKEIKNWRDKNFNSFSTRIDDATVFIPAAIVYGLDLLHIKSTNDPLNQTILFAKTSFVTMAFVYGLKYSTNVARPDGSDNQSFPSAHTAMAFAYATVLDKEFKNTWISIAGYGVATATGAMRILNNKHWFSDVVVGAGLGILSTNLVYATHQNKYKWDWRKNSALLPNIGNNQYGLMWLKTF